MKLLALALAVPTAFLPQAIPPRPEDGRFTHDLAGMLDANAEERIAAAQKTAYEKHDVPLVVVTIERMGDYGGRGMEIEDFARAWFDGWEIGTLGRPDGRGANKGILLLVSEGDRRARIELGADWGRGWDDECRRVMDGTIIPRFKEGKFALGIADGCEFLGALAAIGPEGDPPGPGWGERLVNSPGVRKISGLTLFPPGWMLTLLGVGMAMIAASFFLPAHRKILLLGGLGLIAVAVFTWVVIVVLAAVLKSRFRSSESGGFGSGGGFGGGFSGGGGASGRW